ncbi:MAG: L,D-transpeptidase/peptidoglycan binding protein [Clostridiales bacterium]|nr:L,D-transpeptidase/peptidoglycan binding protein [Clostridiales bacterium]
MGTKEKGHKGNQKKKKITKKKQHWMQVGTVIGMLVLFILLAGGVLYFADAARVKEQLGRNITVNGQKVGGQTAEEAAGRLDENFRNGRIVIKENGGQVYELSWGEAGYYLDTASLAEMLNEVIQKQKPGFSFLKEPQDITLQYTVLRKDDTFSAAFTAEKIAGERTDSADAYLTFDEEQEKFVIIPEVYGTKISAEALQAYVGKILEEQTAKAQIPETTEINLDDSVYSKPNITSQQEDLQNQMNTLNQQIEKYHSTSVKHLFGDTSELIDGDTICSWLVVENNTVQLSEEAVRDYVEQLAAKYNTMYRDRNFKTTSGETVKLEHNEYGYLIDKDGEFEKLYAELSSGEAIEREPVYSKEGYKRNGKDDLAGSYIEVSIEKQHLWLYKDGSLITETDIVTGKPQKETATYKGAWPIAYKASPYVLSSDYYGYEVPVEYWMPFVYGQGLHDINRSAFGGEIYKTNGSHGCVNLPKDQAKLIYETIEKGYPIILY